MHQEVDYLWTLTHGGPLYQQLAEALRWAVEKASAPMVKLAFAAIIGLVVCSFVNSPNEVTAVTDLMWLDCDYVYAYDLGF